MLTIRRKQLEIFEGQALQRFEDEMVSELTRFAPAHAAVVGAEGMRAVVQQGIAEGQRQRFTLRGPLRTFLQLTFLFGHRFTTDPLCPWATEALEPPTPPDEMARASRLFDAFAAYDQQVGAEGHPPAEVLRAARARVTAEPPPDGRGLDDFLAREAEAIYPRRCAYLGVPRLRAFFQGVRRAAAERGDTTPGAAVLAGKIAFLFGHGYADDPGLPWTRDAGGLETFDPAAKLARGQERFAGFLEKLLPSV